MTKSIKYISHLDLDTFFVSASRLQNSELIGRPVLVGGLSQRAVVASCSYEARRFGIHAGMSMQIARRLCAEAVVIRGDMDLYKRKSDEVTEIISETAPCFEKASIDEHYLDLTGMDRFFGVEKLVQELRQRIVHETGLPISFGLSINKTVAKIATGESKEKGGELIVPGTDVHDFLNPLPIQKMPGIGKKTADTYRRMGVDSLGVLAAIPRDVILRVMGKNGLNVWEKANGIDRSPVLPYTDRKSISSERTFETDTTDMNFLLEKIVGMTEQLCYQLRSKQRLVSVVSVKVRYSNFDTHTKQRRIQRTTLDHEIISVARELFQGLYNRRLLVRLVGVKLDGLVQGFQQLDLFDPNPKLPQLYQAMDDIRNRYGEKAIQRASSLKAPQVSDEDVKELIESTREKQTKIKMNRWQE